MLEEKLKEAIVSGAERAWELKGQAANDPQSLKDREL